MAYTRGSHTLFHHRYHIVWVPKYRFKVLHGDVRLRVREIIRQVCSEMNVTIIKGLLSRDHVHMFVEIPPHVAVFAAYPAGISTYPQTLLGAAVLGEGGISARPVAISPTRSSCAIWRPMLTTQTRLQPEAANLPTQVGSGLVSNSCYG